MGDKVGVWLHPSSGKERQSVQHICMLREERGKCRAGEHGAQVWINGGGGGRLERRHVGHHVCGGVGIQSFRESHTNGSISKTHASDAGSHGSLKDIKVLPDFRETFMKKKCCFILQLNKMPSPNTKKP